MPSSRGSAQLVANNDSPTSRDDDNTDRNPASDMEVEDPAVDNVDMDDSPEDGGDDPADEDHVENDNDDDEEDLEADESEVEEEEEDLAGKRRSGRTRRQPDYLDGKAHSRSGRRSKYADGDEEEEEEDFDDDQGKRRSSRSNKFNRNMKEPTDSVHDLLGGPETIPGTKTKANKKTGRKNTTNTSPSPVASPSRTPPKTRGRHSLSRRKSKSILEDIEDAASSSADGGSDNKDADEDYDMDYHEEDDDDEMDFEEDEDDDETMKMQRILASRTETRKRWKEICGKMNSSEVTDGSRWYQASSSTNVDDDEADDDNIIEERFLVKWNALSYLHVSWETQADLLDQVDNAKTYISTFHRKSENGLLYTQDERKDGDYFDPGYVEVDRILEIVAPDDYQGKKLPATWEEEQATDPIRDLGVVLDNKKDLKAFEWGAGRQFLIKFTGLNYTDANYEFERDLILMDIDYEEKLKEFYDRTKKPTKAELTLQNKKVEDANRRYYILFGEKSNLPAEEKEKKILEYQRQLQEHEFKNGGKLRDYQAEGVTWFLSNYVNDRSCIMADEMGLGKTLQTAAFINLLVHKMRRNGPFLICVPLSTITHWQREFVSWTGLNTIVYHGSAMDRQRIREYEFAYERDRPDSVGVNARYLKKCEPARRGSRSPWMATVVITTPEILVAEDWKELCCVDWEVLVVDEAHRLKNHTSKLAVILRNGEFNFGYKILLTGTPIQNEVKEFWTLLNFIDPENYGDMEKFLDRYGNIESKERIDELHTSIRPYILRRLKEDVEKSVPPKEETLIEVELTLAQKQYYRALYEKNVQFLHKGKKKALDGPSLNNLAMQLRKVCNHLFLLNGVEEDLRAKEKDPIDEGDFVAGGSGKLVLLDKLLPRLKENGHRILIFSQFKIMLDVLEDYLDARKFRFERIDGSITGHKRQAAIDRFQDQTTKDPPFVMLLSTRAGGVGINLTAADTCIIFDSDWNPQNDIQAMARCHRIGQTKNVKVYRLLTRKTYEMQMFHLSSLKMGLDQAVLTGFESGSTGESAMTKEEVEKLLRHGAYDIFNEEKAGKAEAESNAFIQQDIDSILARRARTVVHENTGTGSAAAGGTFSKASFVSKNENQGGADNIDVNDPDFWSKMVGEAKPEAESILKPRKRNQANYNEKAWDSNFRKSLKFEDDNSDSGSSDDDSDDSVEDPDSESQERTRWGGQKPEHWKRNQAQSVLDKLENQGYGILDWDEFIDDLPKDCSKFSEVEIRRMSWSMVLMAVCEVVSSEATGLAKRNKTIAEQKGDTEEQKQDGDQTQAAATEINRGKTDYELKEDTFKKVWNREIAWVQNALIDALQYARSHEPRKFDSAKEQRDLIHELFYGQLWPALQGRGWKEDDDDDEIYHYDGQTFTSPSSVMNEVLRIHPELQNMVIPILNRLEQARLKIDEQEQQKRQQELSITHSNISIRSLQSFLERYSPMQLVYDRTRKGNKISLSRRLLSACNYIYLADQIVKAATESPAGKELKIADEEKIANLVVIDGRTALPHPLWTRKHDAILIQSIAKHGWLDIERNLRRIVGDNDIKWGFPFEVEKNSRVHRMGQQDMENLKSTAERAAIILNQHSEIFKVLPGFNKKLVIDAFGLTHHTDENEMDDDDGKEWRVDSALLHQASKKSEPSSQEAVDLPAKKDLVRRARVIIHKAIAHLNANGRASLTKKLSSGENEFEDPNDKENHGYTLINQADRTNIFLAELIRALVKASTTKYAVQIRKLWGIVRDEAQALYDMLKGQGDKKKEAEEMKQIIGQIVLAKNVCKTGMTQGKNVLRVMIGEKPNVPRKEAELMFPTEKVNEAEAKPKMPAKKKPKRNDPSFGEKALLSAMKKVSKKNAEKVGSPCLFKTFEDESLGLPLAMVEIYILSVLCTEGMPLVDASRTAGGPIKPRTWEDVASTFEIMTRKQLQRANEMVTNCEGAVRKARDQGFESKAIEILAKRQAEAERERSMREQAASQAAGFIEDPSQFLAKKSIVLIERIRKYAGFSHANSGNKASHKYENYLGPKVLSWFGKQVGIVADAYGLVDGQGNALAYCTLDLKKQDIKKIEDMAIGGFLEKKHAKDVISQTAMLSRLRSILVKHGENGFHRKLERAVRQSKKSEDEWETRPSWWEDSSSEHSFLLLKNLNHFGFMKIMEHENARDGFGADDEDYNDMVELGLTKPVIQIRSNQLVRELHLIEDHEEMVQIVQNRKKNFDSLAACHTSTNNNTSFTTDGVASANGTSKPKSTVQTGLNAFFSSGKKKSTKNEKENSIGGRHSPDSLSSTGKRKESPVSDSANKGSADKKTKTASDQNNIVDLSDE